VSLTAHRPARLVSSLLGDDPEELPADLPHLPAGVTLDPQVLEDAACGEQDLQLFYPQPGDQRAERAAKRICAACPVQQACLQMALDTNDEYAILGGTTPQERAQLRQQHTTALLVARARERAASSGIDPAQLKQDAEGRMRAHLLGDASATLRAWELCRTAGVSYATKLLNTHHTTLAEAFEHWGLETPKLRQPAEVMTDPTAAREAFHLVEQVGWVKAARQVRVARRTLRAAFARWGLGEPAPPPGPYAPSAVARDRAAAEAALQLAIKVGVKGAAARLGVDKATLYLAWRRWGLGRPTDRPEGARAALQRSAAAARRADRARHPWALDRSIWQPKRAAGAERAIG
jgi:WhiB family transcriptional regulator, redox-sensing transcriptional regulator